MARTKQVFSNDELPYVWLGREQDTGKTPGGRMYFTGDTIFSYGSHFPIARIRTAPNGEEVILMPTRTYSKTTAKHIWAVEYALRRQPLQVVYCNDPSVVTSHDSNLKRFKNAMDTIAEKHAKARKPWLYSRGIFNEARMAREYCGVMCLPVPAWALLPEGIEPGAPVIAAMKMCQPVVER